MYKFIYKYSGIWKIDSQNSSHQSINGIENLHEGYLVSRLKYSRGLDPVKCVYLGQKRQDVLTFRWRRRTIQNSMYTAAVHGQTLLTVTH